MTRERDGTLEVSLLMIRLGLAAFLLVWVADKFVNPKHSVAVLAGFYALKDASPHIVLGLGIAQLVLVLAFMVGLLRFWTYGAVMVMHAITVAVSWWKIVPPFGPAANILFWAGIPVLAAMIALFLLRDRDRLLAIGG